MTSYLRESSKQKKNPWLSYLSKDRWFSGKEKGGKPRDADKRRGRDGRHLLQEKDLKREEGR